MGKSLDYYYTSDAADPVSFTRWEVYASDDGDNTYRNAAAVGTQPPETSHGCGRAEVVEWLAGLDDIESAFRALDVNGDGMISAAELSACASPTA